MADKRLDHPEMRKDHPPMCAPATIVIWTYDCMMHGEPRIDSSVNLSTENVLDILRESVRILEREIENASRLKRR